MTMKSKTMRHAIKVRLFAAVLLATCVFAGAANAETMAIKFNLPFEVHWGKNLLPAGEYSVTMDSSANVGLVRSANGKVAIYTPIPIKAYSRTGNTALYVLVRGNQRIVRSLNLPSRGISLIYRPTTDAEREMLAQADQLQTVPVMAAGK
jgi:hypothetical protein